MARSTDQVVEVIPLMDGEDSPRRVLCPWRVHPPASTLPAVARATAGRFVRCEWLVGRGVGVPRSLASGFCVSCSPHGWPSVVGVSATVPETAAGPPITRLTRRGERPTHEPLLGSLIQHTTRPIRYSHLTKRPAVARATAGKVLARGCARQGQSIRRRLSSPSMRWNTSATWLVDRAVWQSSSSSCRSWH